MEDQVSGFVAPPDSPDRKDPGFVPCQELSVNLIDVFAAMLVKATQAKSSEPLELYAITAMSPATRAASASSARLPKTNAIESREMRGA